MKYAQHLWSVDLETTNLIQNYHVLLEKKHVDQYNLPIKSSFHALNVL